MTPDPTYIVLHPEDVKVYDPDPPSVRRAQTAAGDVVVHVGPDVHLSSTAAFLLFRIVDVTQERGCGVSIEAGPLKIAVLRVLGFAGVARLCANREDGSWLFSGGGADSSGE